MTDKKEKTCMKIEKDLLARFEQAAARTLPSLTVAILHKLGEAEITRIGLRLSTKVLDAQPQEFEHLLLELISA